MWRFKTRHFFKWGDSIFYLISIIILIILDQFTKYLTVTKLKPLGSVEFIPNILNLTYAENTGAAFSMLENQIWFFVLVTVIILAGMAYLCLKGNIKHILGKISFTLVASGAIGNLIDRVLNGFVVDMFEFAFVKFAIFNVADIFITFGGILCFYYIMYIYDIDNPPIKKDDKEV